MNNHFLPANVAQLKKKGMKGNLNKWKENRSLQLFYPTVGIYFSVFHCKSPSFKLPCGRPCCFLFKLSSDSMNVFKIAHHMLAFSTTAFPMLCLITSGTAMNRSRVYFMPLLTQNTWHQQTVRGNCFLKDLLSFFFFFLSNSSVRSNWMNLIFFFQYLNKEITCKYIDSVSPTVYRVMSTWEILDYIPIPTPILFSFAIVCWCGRAIRSLLLESVLQSRPDIGFD